MKFFLIGVAVTGAMLCGYGVGGALRDWLGTGGSLFAWSVLTGGAYLAVKFNSINPKRK